MKKSALIIYPFVNQEPLVFHLIKSLRENGIQADAINSFNLKYVVSPLQRPSLKLRVFSFILTLPIPKIKGLFSKIINREKELLKTTENYSLIDFHYLTRSYDSLIKSLANKKTIKLTFWGSDFYRANSDRLEEQRYLLMLADRIQITTEDMKKDILTYFKDFENKASVANFGIRQFDIISKIQNLNYSPIFKTEKYKDKLMLTCGYNGSKAQQHSIIIKAIRDMDEEMKARIFLVFPMTYGGNLNYLKSIQASLNELQIPYLLISKPLSDMDVAKLRIETDITINIQISDAFSASLQEHLFAQNLLLVGDWLPYQILTDNQVFFKQTRIDNLSNNIADCIQNFESFREQTRENTKKLHELSSLQVAGKKISEIYRELLK